MMAQQLSTKIATQITKTTKYPKIIWNFLLAPVIFLLHLAVRVKTKSTLMYSIYRLSICKTMELTHATSSWTSHTPCPLPPPPRPVMPPGEIRGRAMAMKDTRAESATGSSPASEALRTEMAATVTRRWWCCDMVELA